MRAFVFCALLLSSAFASAACEKATLPGGLSLADDFNSFVSTLTIPMGAVNGTKVAERDLTVVFKNCVVPNGQYGAMKGARRLQFWLDTSFPRVLNESLFYSGAATGLRVVTTHQASTSSFVCTPYFPPQWSANNGYYVQGNDPGWMANSGYCDVTIPMKLTFYRDGNTVATTQFPSKQYAWFVSYSYMDENGNWGAGTNSIPTNELIDGVITQETFNHWDLSPNNAQVDGGASGTWDTTSSNWTTASGATNGTWPGGSTVAVFSGTAGTVTVNGAQSMGGLDFRTDGYTVTGGSLTGAAATNVLTAATGVSATVASPITGANAVQKAGAGTLTLAGTNTYSGNTTVSAGRLKVTGVLGSGTYGGTISLGSSADNTLEWASTSNQTLSGPLSGSGQLLMSGAATLTLTGTNTYTGITTVSAGTLQVGAGATAGTIGGTSKVVLGSDGTIAFNRSDAQTFASVIEGSGKLSKLGSNTLTLGANNTYTGTTTVSAGTLTLNAAAANTLASNTAVTVASGATLNLNGKTQTFNAQLAVSGTLALGTNASLTLGGAGVTHSVAAITGSGTITVGSGATLELTAAVSNTSVKIELAGGTLRLAGAAAALSYSLGELQVSASSTLQMPSGTNKASLTVSTLTPALGTVLTVADWSATDRRIFATAVTDTPARNQTNLSPLNRVQLGGNATTLTYWASASNELLAGTGPYTYWDPTTGNTTVDGGTGTWSQDGAGWTTQTYTLNGPWAGGTSTAYFGSYTGTTATVTLANGYAPSVGGLSFGKTGYTLAPQATGSGDGSLTLAQTATATVGSASTDVTTINVPLTGGFGLSKDGPGTLVLGAANTYTGITTVSAGTLQVGAGATAGTIASTSKVVLGSDGTIAFNRSDAQTFASVIEGSGKLSKLGSNTLTLGANNTYTGTTTVTAGALLVTGSTAAASAVNVASGATLGGTGTLGGTVAVTGGTVAPGVGGPGKLTTGALTLDAGSTLRLDLAAPGTSDGSVNDVLHVVGDLKLAGAQLQINALANFSTTGSYTLITYTGNRIGGNDAEKVFGSHNLSAVGYVGLIEYDDVNKRVNLVSLPRVRIAQVSQGGVGRFDFTLTGLDVRETSVTTTTAGQSASSSVFSGTQGLSATLTQRAPAGWPQVPASISCVDANGSANGNGTGNLASVSQATASLSSAAMRAGADITCTFTNARNGISGVVFNDGGAPSAGSNTGTPNDGLRNGNEAGLGGVTVALTNCNGTVHASTVTDGQGAYALNVPSQLAGGVCVSVSLPAGYQSTGANAGGTPLPVDTPTTVGGVGLTYQTSSPSVHQVAFAVPGPSALVLDFGQVPLSSFSGDTQRAVMAGLNADHLQRFRAGTGGVLSVSLLASQAVPSGSESAWGSAVFLDASCSGRYQPGASLLSAAGYSMTVIQGQEVCMVTRVSAPASAQTGHSHSVPIRALIQLSSSSLQASFTVNSQTRVGNSAVQLRKEVRNVTAGHVAWSENNQGKRGDELEYRVSFTNMGAAPVTDLEVHDTTGPWTTLVSAGAENLPSGLSCSLISPANGSRSNCSPGVSGGGKGSISWFFDGPLLPQASGSVLYRVRID
jgi:autotransporter-associated beta strand protein